MDTSVSDDNWGAWYHRIFIVATFITDVHVLLEQFLIHTAMK